MRSFRYPSSARLVVAAARTAGMGNLVGLAPDAPTCFYRLRWP